MPHCNDVGCLIYNGSCIRSKHAEQNLLAQADYERLSLKDAIIYATNRPCERCTISLIQVGISEIHFWAPYTTDGSEDRMRELLESLGIGMYGPYEEVK